MCRGATVKTMTNPEMSELIYQAKIEVEKAKVQLQEALICFDTLIEIAKNNEFIFYQLEHILALLH
jgi:regulator of RNase E activity RraB